MASTFLSAKAAAGVQPHESVDGVNCITATYALTAALVDEDIIQMVKLPKGSRVIDLVLSVTDLDTNVSPAIILEVGDGADVDRYIDASTIGQTGGTVRLGSGITTNTQAFTSTADDTIDVHVETAPATGAATGSLTLSVTYTTDI